MRGNQLGGFSLHKEDKEGMCPFQVLCKDIMFAVAIAIKCPGNKSEYRGITLRKTAKKL